jgi:hypothetical protein
VEGSLDMLECFVMGEVKLDNTKILNMLIMKDAKLKGKVSMDNTSFQSKW